MLKKPTKKNKGIIILKDVWKTYKIGTVEVHALRGLNLTIKEGEFVCIYGPSGSGKSTCMNMVGCLDVPTNGEIFLKGNNISHLSESNLAQIRGKTIGFIFQQFNLINTLTAAENVTLPMVFQGYSMEDRNRRALKLLGMVDLSDRMDHKPTELSGGQQQRVAIARSLSNNPEVILADEPTGNLDSKTGVKIMDFLRELKEKEGKTIIMVSHDDSLARYADRIVFLKDGQIIKEQINKRSKK